jgi:Lactate dehydrogenase and related dehydrogenases
MLAHMNNTAVLINISRGAVVDEDALTAALSEKNLYGAVLDILESEPFSHDSPFWDMEGCRCSSAQVICFGEEFGAGVSRDYTVI